MSGLYGPVILMNARYDYTVLPHSIGGRALFQYQLMRDGVLVAQGTAETEAHAHALVKNLLTLG